MARTPRAWGHMLWLAMEDAVVAVRRESGGWTARTLLEREGVTSIARDPADERRGYVGTRDDGVLVTADGGATWSSAGGELASGRVSALASSTLGASGSVFAGTEPSAVYRSDDAGGSWEALAPLAGLPSASSWSYPPRPGTHHVRAILPDPVARGRLFVSVEAGALLRSHDGGRSWLDRTDDGPRDAHALAAHPGAPGRLYAAAGDGWFESIDAGESWRRHMEGAAHGYFWSVAVDVRDPRRVLASAAAGPREAHDADAACSVVYRKRAGEAWEDVGEGLPGPEGTTAATLACDADRPGVFYCASNRGIFLTEDGGDRWRRIEVSWPERFLRQRVRALSV